MKDDPVRICPECGSEVKRLMYPVGIVFKGSGWYVNDSRKPDKSADSESGKAKESEGAKSEASDSKTDSKSEKPADTKSETKTDTKAESKPAASTE